MELLTPEPSLVLWIIVTVIVILLMSAALLHLLYNKSFGRMETLLWAFAIFFIPVLGSLLYFKSARQIK